MSNGATNGRYRVEPGTPEILHDLTEEALLPIEPGDRLWKLFVFRPTSGRATRLEHRIYTKIKPNGQLALVTFAVHHPSAGWVARSGIAHVPDLAPAALDRIIDAIRRETRTEPDEYEEIDLSHLATVAEQLAYVQARRVQEEPEDR